VPVDWRRSLRQTYFRDFPSPSHHLPRCQVILLFSSPRKEKVFYGLGRSVVQSLVLGGFEARSNTKKRKPPSPNTSPSLKILCVSIAWDRALSQEGHCESLAQYDGIRPRSIQRPNTVSCQETFKDTVLMTTWFRPPRLSGNSDTRVTRSISPCRSF